VKVKVKDNTLIEKCKQSANLRSKATEPVGLYISQLLIGFDLWNFTSPGRKVRSGRESQGL